MAWELVKTTPNPWGVVPMSAGGSSLTPRVEEHMTRVLQAAEKRDCPSRRHHYVPQAYLRAWSQDGKRVRVLNKATGDDGFYGVADLCVRKNFYRVTDRDNITHNQVEAMLAVIDDDTALLLARLRSWKPGDDVSLDDFMALAVAAAMQKIRTPQQRRHSEAMEEWKARRLNQPHYNFITDTHVDLLFRSRYDAADELTVRQLEIWDDLEGRFITGDQPVLHSEEAPGIPGSTLTADYVWWPISPTRLLAFGRELTGNKVDHRQASTADVDKVRRHIIRGAETLIIASPGDTKLPTGKRLARRPQLRTDCEPLDPAQNKCRIGFGWGYGTDTIDRVCDPACAVQKASGTS